MPTYERQAGAASQGALGAQSLSHVALCDLMDCSPPVSSVQGISWQQYWSGWPFPTPGNLPDPEIKPMSSALHLRSPRGSDTYANPHPCLRRPGVSRERRHSYHLEESGKANQEVAIKRRRDMRCPFRQEERCEEWPGSGKPSEPGMPGMKQGGEMKSRGGHEARGQGHDPPSQADSKAQICALGRSPRRPERQWAEEKKLDLESELKEKGVNWGSL